MTFRRGGAALLVLGALGLAGTPAAALDLEQALASWRQAWVVIKVPSGSNCDQGYTNNEVPQGAPRADVQLGPGELAQVHKIEVKRDRLEVLLNLDEGYLEPRREGPFELFEDARCKVELELPVPRAVIKGDDLAGAERVLASYLARFTSEAEARRSELWNRRQKGRLPKDYEQTLAAWEKWKREQYLLRLDEEIDEALDELEQARRGNRTSPEYADGLAAGLEAQRYVSFSSCQEALDASFWTKSREVPKDRRKDRDFVEGFDNGQRLAFFQERIEELRDCRARAPR
jgi:hypothetical protein